MSDSLQVGRHNLDLESSRLRILEGGSWKQQRVIWLIPSGKQIDTKVYLSHIGLIRPPNQAFAPMLCLGMEVGEAYSKAIEAILAHPDLSGWEYILTIETDNVPPPDGLLKLLRRMEMHPEFACIGGLYWTKGEGGVPQIWGDVKDPMFNCRPQPPKKGELVECCATGMGFNLWRVAAFKTPGLRKPWFKTVADKTGTATQDIYFWSDAKKYGLRCAIDCDVLVGHLDVATGVCW